MKYPQLVSTRAVNAISDWLVSRLEQLGVDAPHIYSRLLLSLLQSSVQINDPIEFNSLETFFGNEKGNNRRYFSCEPNTLKKINAIQCLREIVSADQEITPIELLVDELFEKLIAIEKQSVAVDDADNSFHHLHFNKSKKRARKLGLLKKSGSSSNANKTTADLDNKYKQKESADSESPKKRYFRAFPALTKEMESFGIFKKDSKSLTWPVDETKINRSGIPYKDSGGCLATISTHESQTADRYTAKAGGKGSIQKHQILISDDINAHEDMTTSIVKRRARRRRNQGPSKGRNLRKINYGIENNNHYNNLSPFWDTDFEGCWEMGPDLIKEFMQNNRNSCSASKNVEWSNELQQNQNQLNDAEKSSEENKFIRKSDEEDIQNCSSLIPSVDILFCCHDDDDITSVSEIMSASLTSTRPLYQRDINDSSQDTFYENISDDQFDFAKFRAKFDSGLEALWSDIPDVTENVNAGRQQNNLYHFWTSCYNNRFNLAKISQGLQTAAAYSEKLFCNNLERDITNPSDYYSMPCIVETSKRFVGKSCDAPVGVFLQNSIWSDCFNGLGVAAESKQNERNFKNVWNSSNKIIQLDPFNSKVNDSENHPPERAFHLSSQYVVPKWSEGINAGPRSIAAIYNTIQPALQHLYALTNETSSSITSASSVEKHLPKIDEKSTAHLERRALSNTSIFPTTSIPSHCIWTISQMPQNFQANPESWALSKPKSLNEIYTNSEKSDDVGSKYYLESRDGISLPNHSSSTSGFVEYSRVKLSSSKNLKYDNNISKSVPQLPYQYPIRTKDCCNIGEDLLNSELTHFRPIKPYEDGHSFYICSALDVVDYERSESGYLYWESEKYLEYIHNDAVLTEEDPATHANNTSDYTISNCRENVFNSSAGRHHHGFVIKIRIRNCDAACQTEATNDYLEKISQTFRSNLSPPLQSLTAQTMTKSDVSNVLNGFAQTTAVVAQTAPILCYRSDTSCLATTSHYNSGRCRSNGFDVKTAGAKLNIDLEQWSMYEIRKKCELKNESRGADLHTLWGMCAACNNEYKSIPANRLLKDEIMLEADQIMSDLRYMQDLYIGEGVSGDSESELEIGETETNSEGIFNGEESFSLSDSTKSSPSDEFITVTKIGRKTKDQSLQIQKHAAQSVFNKVNRLIADLLWRETCEPIFSSPITKDNIVGSNCKENIWQQSIADIEPINSLHHLRSAKSNSPLIRNGDDEFLSKLSWDHNYLADIWKKKTPPLNRDSSATPYSPGDENFLKYRGINRKRRHSAAQNDCHASSGDILSNNCNELTDKNEIRESNRINYEILSNNCNELTDTNQASESNRINYEMNNNCINRELSSVIRIKNVSTGPLCQNSNKSFDETVNVKQPKQTVITCKYWTRIGSKTSSSAPGFVQGSTFSRLLNKNTSILKHVTLITRPLTR